MIQIYEAVFPDEAGEVIAIWQEFIANSSVNLAYQKNKLDPSLLPGEYSPPNGRILLARRNGAAIGSISMRRIDASICEMKRLYVRPVARGMGIGRTLSLRLIEEARSAGYQEVRLDVHGEFLHARQIYADLGFTDAEPVSHNPVAGARFLGLLLT